MSIMLASIIVALITGGLSLIGVIITNVNGNRQIESKLITGQAITDTKLEILTSEVKKHNEFTERIPVMESKIERLEYDVENLKGKVK